jgi:hypothetical protein
MGVRPRAEWPAVEKLRAATARTLRLAHCPADRLPNPAKEEIPDERLKGFWNAQSCP